VPGCETVYDLVGLVPAMLEFGSVAIEQYPSPIGYPQRGELRLCHGLPKDRGSHKDLFSRYDDSTRYFP
jgi:hypothetical protein